MVLVRSEQVQISTMGEEGGPKGPVNGRDPSPASAAVTGLEDMGHGAAVFRAFGAKLVVGGNVIAVCQNGQAGRADVNARGSRAMVDDHARHNWRVSGKQNAKPGVDRVEQIHQRQAAQAFEEFLMRRDFPLSVNCLVQSDRSRDYWWTPSEVAKFTRFWALHLFRSSRSWVIWSLCPHGQPQSQGRWLRGLWQRAKHRRRPR